ACGDVSGWNTGTFSCCWHGDGCVGQRGSAKRSQVDGDDFVRGSIQCFGDFLSGLEFSAMPLTVIDAECVTIKLTVFGDRQRGGGIESAGQQYDGFGSGLNGLCLHRFIVLARLPRAVYAVESAYARAVGRAKSSL